MRNCCYKKMMMNSKMQNTKCCNNNINHNMNINTNNSCESNYNNTNNCGCNNRKYDCNCNEDNERNCSNRELMQKMKMELQEIQFAIQELALYLDTHPEDTRAVCMHNEQARRYRKLADEYEKVYGPLTIMFPCNSWRWLEEPWPWENNGNYQININNRGSLNNTKSDKKESVEQYDSEQCDYDLKGGII